MEMICAIAATAPVTAIRLVKVAGTAQANAGPAKKLAFVVATLYVRVKKKPVLAVIATAVVTVVVVVGHTDLQTSVC